MKIYILFQTDIWQTKNSYVFFGAFSSYDKANESAKDNNLYHHEACVIIYPIKLDRYTEV